MLNRSVKKALEDLAEEVKGLFHDMMRNAPKTHPYQETLDEHSNIWHRMQISLEDEGLIRVIFPEYLDYIDGIAAGSRDDWTKYPWGRRPYFMVKGEKEFGAWIPPIRPIYEWLVHRGLPTDNQTLYAMRIAIALNGIKARPVFDNWEGNVDKLIDDNIDNIINAIIEELDNYFNK